MGTENRKFWVVLMTSSPLRDQTVGKQEIVVGRSGGALTVYDGKGAVVWANPAFDSGSEIRSLAVDDLDRDGQIEVVVGRASGGSTRQINVIRANGSAWLARTSRRRTWLWLGNV